MTPRRRAFLGLVLAGFASAAHAIAVVAATPQGEVAQVRQVTVKFSDAVVPLGDLRLPDPFAIACQGRVPEGSGRWADPRTWLYDFREPLGPGIACTATLRPGWRSAVKPAATDPAASATGGAAVTGTTRFAFRTGGPAVVRVDPGEGSEIEEDQHFLLRLNGAADAATVAGNAWCEVEGLGDRVRLVIVGGDARAQVLKARGIAPAAHDRTLLARCERPLPNEAAMRLVWGKGIAAPGNPKLPTTVEQAFRYTVRAAFTADFSCERERANAGCMPIRPMTVRFSAPVPRDLAARVRLRPAAGDALAPRLDTDDRARELSELQFPTPLPENASFSIEMPAGVKDVAGRPLANASAFPLKVQTASTPPIAKFAAAPFGIVERAAEAALPVTLRHVQADLRPGSPAAPRPAGQVRVKRLVSDLDILAWYARVQKYHETELTARELGFPQREWTTLVEESDAEGRVVKRRVDRMVGTREVSLLARDPGARRLDLPMLAGGDPRPFEVVGIPLAEPGYHVVEIESLRLGQALLDKRAPMYVRTGVLVTNLGVHFKQGRENSVVWVTTLDRGKPVAGADIAVRDCNGRLLWSGRSDAAGLAVVPRPLDANPSRCEADAGYFVSARSAASGDVAFVFSGWQKGIEAWRFHVPTGEGREPQLRAATVFDRTLFRAGETVSMKHFVRRETSSGLAPAGADRVPTRVKIVHQGSGQEVVMPLAWSAGGRSALSTWNIPPAAKLGVYDVVLEREAPASASTLDSEAGERRWTSGSFRVEEFRVPLIDARLGGPKAPPVAASSVAVDVQMSYLAGGAMAGAPLRASALLKPRSLAFAGYDEFSFEPPRNAAAAEGEGGDDAERPANDAKLIADKVALVTDRNGVATFRLKDLPKTTRPSQIEAEVTFNDPNGETQTAATRVDLWPSAVVLGVKASRWVSNRGRVQFSALALDLAGKPIRGQKVVVNGRISEVVTTRKRLVGGLYGYDNRSEVKELGKLCSGSTDERGLLLCDARLDSAGQVELIAQAADAQGHPAEAAASVWITRQGELWFAQDNDDRIDVLPEKQRYEPGETARLQVRMPFREATALVAVEREGVLATQVVALRGDDPTIALKIEPTWGPNVYVSVLALRGRIHETRWYSFFTWGWKAPLAWWQSFWHEGRDYQAPTAMVDLAKPSFKLGVANLKVGLAAHQLAVSVTTDKPQYTIRQKAIATVKVTHAGKPLAGVEVAFAAVDEGLLALRGNDSWALLEAMMRERAWSVETSTAQSEIIGRRHYGRKAVAPGGGGGRGATRELFDTLLVWKPSVVLDANGEARVEVPLNDALTSFRLVAVADADVQKFGTGSTRIKVSQDLQVLAGLPPLVRDGDRFAALLTLRNTTAREMTVRAALRGTANLPGPATGDVVRVPIALAPQDVALAAGQAKEVVWPVDVPADAYSIVWEASADAANASDRLKVTQLVAAAVPLRVLQATIAQLDGRLTLPVAAPVDALPATGTKRGGVDVAVQPKLTGALPGIRRYFETYPFACLEQKASKAIGLRDASLWAGVANALPTYLDSDGLASYFPPRADDPPHGSDRLTAYVLAAAHESGFELPAPAREAMLGGLAAFVEGRIERRFWAPRADLDVRKLAAIEALSRHGRAHARMLGSIALAPNTWPTAALIDWLNILKRVDGVPDRAARLEEAQQIVRARLTYAGTTLRFSTEESDFWWWLMDSADANAARLVLAVLDDPAWKDELPRLVVGSLARQKGGAWLTTTANLWGSLALDKFSARFELQKVAGRTVASFSAGSTTAASAALPGALPASAAAATTAARPVADWATRPAGGAVRLAWPERPATLAVAQDGTGKPWLTVQSIAAIPLQAPLRAGYAVTRSVSAVERRNPQAWSRGDIVKVRLEIDAQADMTWVVVSDPVPGGATILGSGLGRDSQIATRGEQRSGGAAPAFEERGFEAFRAYYEQLPRGRHVVEYTVRLNNPGRFALPPTRVEAMYAPETFGEAPNAPVEIAP
ncbi:alpha-2-macroglobulin family protein [Piscinibacter koreensis]|uniref:Alpha-2-macroglobulin n=1 Tax=Piscinibacter koreensis TaxID=2742824 RepID=A0A7Y6TYC6_9BURK|nr:MG2 domain-containing protein [Schlegelella koreensis]NUZ07956.1 alpha-2-macroglobulin [Schlegelella koreensis]